MQQTLAHEEILRLLAMSSHEIQLRQEGFRHVAGIDEAGRGPLAGPVVAAACILPPDALFAHLNDSKLLSEKQREILFAQITQTAIFGIGIVDEKVIDEINILQATFLAMQKAVAALPTTPDALLLDGNQIPRFDIPAKAIVKGDSLSVSIAAASVIAKVTRDRLLIAYDAEYPQYGFKKHKGYGTAEHLQAIQKWGPCPIHRLSFKRKREF
jgi:ribonuclease HII